MDYWTSKLYIATYVCRYPDKLSEKPPDSNHQILAYQLESLARGR